MLKVFTPILKVGIPNGSLIDSNRGGLKELLANARIDIKNLGESGPLETLNIPWLYPIPGRPQELPALAADGYVDVFFCGDDWAREWELRGKQNKKILGLGTGKVEIVFASKGSEVALGRIASEYPYITRDFMQNIKDVSLPITPLEELAKSSLSCTIVPSYGTTEAKNYYGICDSIVEASQSGNTLEKYGLKIIQKVMASECSLYSNEDTLADPWKRKKAFRLKMMLEGVISAKGKDLITFNVPNRRLGEILEYIQKNRLFGDEETVIRGKRMSEITLEVSSRDRNLPLIDIIGDLKDRGASSIEGIPLSYSIR